MSLRHIVGLLTAAAIVSFLPPSASALDTTVVAEAHYLMADGDTLAQAEEKVLQRAKRKAIEEAGMYIESTLLDIEKTAGGRSFQASSLEIRTIASAITKTEVLESSRSFEQDRPSFFVRIRALVDLDHLQDAIRRWQSEQQLAEHFRRLQKENSELKAQLREIKKAPLGVHTLVIDPPGRAGTREQARTLIEKAILTPNLRQKLDLTSEAAVLDPQATAPLVVRGQTYLQLVSAAYSKKAKLSEYSKYIDNARMDFDRALIIDPQSIWALLGQGDVYTWLHRTDDAVRSYERALALDPLFDVAHLRLLTLYTSQARKLMTAKQWSSALAVLQNTITTHVPDGWMPYYKEAYLLRSDLYRKLNQPAQAIDDLSAVLRAEPADMQALLTRATLYREQLQGRLAKDDFEHACMLGSVEACKQIP
jgi:tetratricopeptide (TPR) repeat protein